MDAVDPAMLLVMGGRYFVVQTNYIVVFHPIIPPVDKRGALVQTWVSEDVLVVAWRTNADIQCEASVSYPVASCSLLVSM
jgi:hypothetical protein